MTTPEGASTAHAVVIDYWFGGDLAQKNSSLWFVPAGVLRDQVDSDITERFGGLLHQAEAGKLQDWAEGSSFSLLALVLLLDQCSRHVYRRDALAGPVIKCNTLQAAKLVDLALSRRWHDTLPGAMLCFLLMPLRHLDPPDPERLDDVLRILQARRERDTAHSSIIEKFRRATEARRVGVCCDSANASTPSVDVEVEESAILAHRAFDAPDEAKVAEEAVCKSLLVFLRHRLEAKVVRTTTADGEVCSVRRAVLCVSLSGGVDSMVITRLLVHLQRSGKLERLLSMTPAVQSVPLPLDVIVAAVHLNYRNRPESDAEMRFVRRWCSSLGVQCFVRCVEEARRGTMPRDEYERKTRAIRFEFYRDVLSSLADGSGDVPEDRARCVSPWGVMLGHHRGDVQENVLSNVMKGARISELSGMADVSVCDGVAIWRPLLAHDKADILRCAHLHGVPYFNDSTPRWSTRGKLRNEVIPSLRQTYGDGFRSNLSLLATQSDQLANLLERTLFAPFRRDRVVRGVLATRIDCGGDAVEFGVLFWHTLLRDECFAMGAGNISSSAASQFVARLESSSRKRPGRKGGKRAAAKCEEATGSRAAAYATTEAPSTQPTIRARPDVRWLQLKSDQRACLCDRRWLLLLRPQLLVSGPMRPVAQRWDRRKLERAERTLSRKTLGLFDVSGHLNEVVASPGSEAGALAVTRLGPWRLTLRRRASNDPPARNEEWPTHNQGEIGKGSSVDVWGFLERGSCCYALREAQRYVVCERHGTGISFWQGAPRPLRMGLPIVACGGEESSGPGVALTLEFVG